MTPAQELGELRTAALEMASESFINMTFGDHTSVTVPIEAWRRFFDALALGFVVQSVGSRPTTGAASKGNGPIPTTRERT